MSSAMMWVTAARVPSVWVQGLKLRPSYRSWHPELSHVSVLQLLEVLVRTLSKLINRCQAPGMSGGLALAAEPS